ncbi:MAG TPA: hypothetical protein VIL71_19280 [Spirillospora sp.]
MDMIVPFRRRRGKARTGFARPFPEDDPPCPLVDGGMGPEMRGSPAAGSRSGVVRIADQFDDLLGGRRCRMIGGFARGAENAGVSP